MRGHITAIGTLYVIFACIAALIGILIMVGSAQAPAAVEELAEEEDGLYVTGEEGETVAVTEEGISVTGSEGEEVHVTKEQLNLLARIGGTFGAIILVFGALGVITGIGLLMLAPWGRILGIIIGILWLPWFPIGTAIGVYALIILFNTEAVGLFAGGAPPQAQPQVPPQTPPPPPPTAEQ